MRKKRCNVLFAKLISIDMINKHIIAMNQSTSSSTPYTHSIIYKRRGQRPSYYKWIYTLLEDGVHGTLQTKKGWAHCISKAIVANRTTQTPETNTQEEHTQHLAKSQTDTELHTDTEDKDSDTEEELLSPKRSSKSERRIKPTV